MSNRLRNPEEMAEAAAGRVTLRDLAETLDMTKATVSRALSGKGRVSAATRQRVLQKAAEVGYEANVQAQQLRTQTNNTIAIFSRSLDLGVATMKVELLQRALIGLGYRSISMSATSIGPVKAMLTELPLAELQAFFKDNLGQPSTGMPMRALLQAFADDRGIPV